MGWCRFQCDPDENKFDCCLECEDKDNGNCNSLQCDFMEEVDYAEQCKHYSCVHKDKEKLAIDALNAFTKMWCRKETNGDELVFNCGNCDFQDGNSCLIKKMANKIDGEYCAEKGFGSMSR